MTMTRAGAITTVTAAVYRTGTPQDVPPGEPTRKWAEQLLDELEPFILARIADSAPAPLGVVVRPGDTLIVRLPSGTTHENAQIFKDGLREKLPEVRSVVLSAEQILVMRGPGHADLTTEEDAPC